MNSITIIKKLSIVGIVLLIGVVLSSMLVSVSWGIMIHERAYHCVDDTGAFLGFFDSLESCRQYDQLATGWTWERVETMRGYHLTAFWMVALCLPLYVGYKQFGTSVRSEEKTGWPF